jgi:tetratricopeptide (TPR) repeat protein
LKKNKAVIFLNNGCTRNMGLIRSMYNPRAKTSQRVLLFADSFVASLMYLFSEFFEHVVFVRSQYFHREMVAALRPDVVITANAERYLAHVHHDDEAGIAFFVAFMNGLNFDRNNPFYEYIDAITKRQPKALEDFFTKYSMTLFHQEKKPEQSVILVNAWQAAGHHLSVNLALLRSRCSAVLKDLNQSWHDAEYALQISNHSITTIGHAVAVRLHQKEYQSALMLCQQLIEKNPKSWLGYRSAAVALCGLNRKAEGLLYLEQGIQAVDEPSELLKMKESY